MKKTADFADCLPNKHYLRTAKLVHRAWKSKKLCRFFFSFSEKHVFSSFQESFYHFSSTWKSFFFPSCWSVLPWHFWRCVSSSDAVSSTCTRIPIPPCAKKESPVPALKTLRLANVVRCNAEVKQNITLLKKHLRSSNQIIHFHRIIINFQFIRHETKNLSLLSSSPCRDGL